MLLVFIVAYFAVLFLTGMAVGWNRKPLVVVVLCGSCLAAPVVTTIKSDRFVTLPRCNYCCAVSGTFFAFLLVVFFFIVLIELFVF